MSAIFSSLKFRNYRIWFAAALVANVGTWMQRVAQDWLVMTRLSNDSSLQVGIVTALQFLPILFLSPIAGLLADRLDRRKLLLATQAAQGVLAIGLGVLVLSETVQLWHVYLFAAALGAVGAIDNPVRQVFVAQLVPPTKLANAVGLNSASFNGARLIGPGLAGLLIAWIGTGWVFVINAATFLATIGAMLALRMADTYAMPPAPRSRGQIREGLRYVKNRSDLMVILVIMGVISCLGLNFQINSVAMARTVFGLGAESYGMLSTIMAIGAVTGSLLAARRERPRVRLVIASAIAFGLSTGISALMPTYWTYALSGILVGFTSNTLMTSANATIQLGTDPQMRGRVMATYLMVFQGATPIGSPLVGWIAEAFGARWSVAVGSISALAVGIAAAIWTSRHWHVTVRYRLRSRPHVQIRRTIPGPSQTDG